MADTRYMSNSHTPTFRVEFSGVIVLTGTEAKRVSYTPAAWDCKQSGKPSDETLATYVRGVEDSTLPGGVNEHLGVTRISRAKVVRQSTDEVVATYGAPTFQVI